MKALKESENYSIELCLALVTTDPNRLLGKHWKTKHSKFGKIKQDIKNLSLGKSPQKPLTKFEIKITRYAAGLLDWDNLVSSMKPVIDGLTLAGIIKDDSWEYIRHIEMDQVKTKKNETKKLIVKVAGC